MSDHKVYKPKPISGFPEWLPEYRAVELEWLDKIRAVFESYGFCSIETPAVEEIDALMAKGGETEKEIYTLTRLQAEEDDKKEARLALHFDLTVPMARYVAQHFGGLVFPFKRYQIQKSFRGERPQKGRYREFYQCDIDVVNVDTLPLHFDAELPAVLFEAYQAIGIPPVEIHISNRKVLIGYLQGLGVTDKKTISDIAINLDKLDKLKVTKVNGQWGVKNKDVTSEELEAYLSEIIELPKESKDVLIKCLDLVFIKSGHPNDEHFIDSVKHLGVKSDLLTEGLTELKFVIDNLKHLPKGAVIVNLGIIRGLDYYTGSVFEVRFQDTSIGSLAIGGGGRYDDLAGSFINQKLPGIGISIGLTRLFGLMMDKGLIKPGPKSPSHVLVVLPEESLRAEASAITIQLRSRGYNVEMYHRDAKIKNQLAYAEKKGIPYVWFPPFKEGQPHEVKNMSTGEQSAADPKLWKIS